MKHLGDYDPTAVLYGKFTTFRPSTGAAFTLAGTPAISVYKDNSTTQSTAGVTLTADFDSVTGLNHFAIDTSADGTFYAAGSFFDIVITTGTVDSVSVVGSVVASFTLRKDSSLKPTTAARTLDVTATGEAGIDWANIGAPTTTVNLSGTTVKTATDVETDTADIQTRLPAALVSGRMDSSVGAMAANVLTATAINADAFTAAKFAADVTTEFQTGLATAASLTTVEGKIDTIDGIVDAILVDTAEIGAAGAGLTALATQTSVNTIDDFLDTEIAALVTAVDALPTNAELATALGTADDAVLAAIAALTIPTATQTADAVLTRQFSDVTPGAGTRDLMNAGRFIRNGFSISGATLSVLEEDDTTTAYTRNLTTDASADPIVGVD
jgi:hypothetical protein